MTSILKVDTIQTTAGAAPTAKDLGFASGSVVQVINNKSSTYITTTSSSFVEASTDYRTTITPKYSDSKILFFCGLGIGVENNSSHDSSGVYKLYDQTAGADVANTETRLRCYDYGGSGLYMQIGGGFSIQIDSWGTTAKTFTFQVRNHAGVRVRVNDECDNTYMTIMEIAQ